MWERKLQPVLICLAAGGSLALLLGAFAFQYLGGLAPCALCLLQRWPHAAAIVIGALALKLRYRWLAAAGAGAVATSAAIGFYHSGVELGWWEGLASCAASLDITSITPEEALHLIMTANPASCDQVAWEMLGLSMATWNALLSSVLGIVWILAARSRYSK
jgi:disulfide bond formation protein DsbB